MNGKERTINALERKPPIDRLPVCDALWMETIKKWIDEGHVRIDETIVDHFGYDIICGCGLNSIADHGFKNIILEEDDDSILLINQL